MPYNASLARTLIDKICREKAMEIYHAYGE